MYNFIKRGITGIILICFLTAGCLPPREEGVIDIRLPGALQAYISSIKYAPLGNSTPEIQMDELSGGLVKVHMTFDIKDSIRQDDWRLMIQPAFTPTFHWAPHLTPSSEHIISQHVFRAPALIVSGDGKQLSVIPDLDIMLAETPVPWYMDMEAGQNILSLGLSKNKVDGHVLFKREKGAIFPPGKLQFGFYIMVHEASGVIEDPWRDILAFFWDKWGKPLYDKGEPVKGSLQPYARHTYHWAFESWQQAVWQEFSLHGKKVGAPVFIVNVTQSGNYPGLVDEREFRSIWNQAWFSSLRSAQGVYRYGRRTNNADLIQKANLTKELALSFPQREGFFHGLIATEMEQVEIEGKKYNRSKGWDTYYYGNSNRNPYTFNPREAPFHLLDMSWTCSLMLDWYNELEKDPRLLVYAERYARSLIALQDEDGFFPGWLSLDSLQPLDILNKSPETSMSVTFLLKLFQQNGENRYKEAAVKAMDAVIRDIIPIGQWEDFETYWSCSRYGSDTLVNRKVIRNNMFKQNNFSIYWTAEALYHAYKATGEVKYLKWGQRTLDELLMMQATWQPPYMYIRTLGGFGVMNADGEWNDSRQSLFAELIVKYGKELGLKEYEERGLAALRSSFVMMYCPENPVTKIQWEKKWDFFAEGDYGFMMENYGHGGVTDPNGVGIGEFTIYDWGNGAASEAYNRMLDHFGEAFVSGTGEIIETNE